MMRLRPRLGVYIVALIFVLVFLINRVAEREAAR